ncbi:hypothetical protein Tco_0807180 [Tanacetum coccineum]
MDFGLNNQNDQWELKLDIDDSNLRLTYVMRPCSSTRVKTSTTTQKPVRIIPNHASIVQAAKLLKQTNIWDGGEECVMSIQEYIKKIVKDVGEDEGFKCGSWVSAIQYVNANCGIMSGCLGDIKNFLKNAKLDKVVAIVKSCTPNVLDDLTVTLKDLLGKKGGSIHHKFINDKGYGKDITVFCKDIVLRSCSGVGGSGMLDEEEIMKLLEEEEMADLKLQVCGNVNDEEDQNKLDEEALNLALEEARAARAEHE